MTEPTPHVRLQPQEDVLTIELARPERRNAIDMPMFAALADALSQAQHDGSVRAVLLVGEGAAFCAGHDLQAFAQWPQEPGDPVPRFLHALAALRKSLVVAVQGFAVGIGATALLHADWVLAAPDAKLRFPFVDIGIAPEAGSSLLLPMAVGGLRARQLLLGGEAIDAAQALAFGLVTEVCEAGRLRELARGRAAELAAKPTALVQRLKDLLAPERLHARIDEEIAEINRLAPQARALRVALHPPTGGQRQRPG